MTIDEDIECTQKRIEVLKGFIANPHMHNLSQYDNIKHNLMELELEHQELLLIKKLKQKALDEIYDLLY